MTIKRFKYFLEQNIAADYVAPADDDEEVKDYKPRSKGEEKFKNLHKVEVSPHPVAKKHQHTTEETEVDEAMWPGTPEYKAKFDPKHNKYDPKGEMRKKLALKPYGDREDPEDSPVSSQTKGRGRPKKYADKNEEVEVEEQAPVAPTLDKNLESLQKTVDYAQKHGYDIKRSPSGKSITFYNKKLQHKVRATIFNKGKDVNFHDHSSGVSGNDETHEFVHTFKSSHQGAKEDKKREQERKSLNNIKFNREEVEIEEEVMSDLKKIVEKKQVMNVKFTNGRTEEVDLNTAKAILELHNRVDEQNKMKIERMVNSSPTNFMKVVDLAMGGK